MTGVVEDDGSSVSGRIRSIDRRSVVASKLTE